MVKSVDESVGRIMHRLEELNLRNDTLVVFTSDNGGLTLNNVTHNLNLRAGKGSAYEGGVRVPWIVSYPARIRPATENAYPVITCDLFPTLAVFAGAKDMPENIDGMDLSALLTGAETIESRPLFWHYPHYHPGGATPYGAVREGDYRLIEFYETGKRELYNLAADPQEKKDLADEKPDLTDRLHKLLGTWRKEVGAQMPTVNPNYEEGK
jgi:arylsulfatase A-like enzyme